MKKAIYWMQLILLLMALLCGCGNQSVKAEDFTYDLEDGAVAITGYLGTDREIRVPDQIENRPVTRIGEKAFEGYDMTEIELPATIEEIGDNAFADCNCMESITIPDKVQVIGENAFYHCDALEEVVLSEDLKEINDGAFNYCRNLTMIKGAENVDKVGEGAFAHCDALYKEMWGEWRLTEERLMQTMADFTQDFTERYIYDEQGNVCQRHFTNNETGDAYFTDYLNEYVEGKCVKTVLQRDNRVFQEITRNFEENGYTVTTNYYDILGYNLGYYNESVYNNDGECQTTVDRAKEDGYQISNAVWIKYFDEGDTLRRVENTYDEYGLKKTEVYNYETFKEEYVYSYVEYVRDEFGRSILSTTYDSAGKITDCTEYIYDSNGNLSEQIAKNQKGEETSVRYYNYEKVK